MNMVLIPLVPRPLGRLRLLVLTSAGVQAVKTPSSFHSIANGISSNFLDWTDACMWVAMGYSGMAMKTLLRIRPRGRDEDEANDAAYSH